MTAANTVLENGGKVLVLDKSSFCGGNSSKATSGINGSCTQTQKNKQIEDSNDLFLSDTLKGGAKKPEIAKVLVWESGPAVDWLMQTFDLDLSLVARLGGHSAPRTHRGKERFPGMTITYALIQMVERVQENTAGGMARIINKAKVFELITNNGAVIGCKYEKGGDTIQAFGPVILASGGFGADFTSDSLLAKYRPDLIHLPTSNGEHCTGDGIKMGEAVGAASLDLEWVQVHPTGLVKVGEEDAKVKFLAAEALRGVGGLLIDAEGNRFANELGRRDYVTGEMWKNKAPFRLCLNSLASTEIHWHCEHYKGRGVMKKYDSGADLAKELGVSVKKLEAVWQVHYEASEKEKQEPDGGPFQAYPSGKSWDEPSGKTGCGKKFYHNVIPGSQFAAEPFHVAIVTPVIHYCMGGLEITTQSEVVTSKGVVIPGLYAAGEVAGGVHGNNRLGGSSLLDCVAFGRVAGKACAKYMLGENVTDVSLKDLAGGDPAPKPVSSGTPISAAPAAGGAVAGSPGFSMDEVAKHTTKDDCWVVLHGRVLNVTSFLKDHPGGELAILTFAGKDATAEFDMIHPPDVIEKYAAECVIGTLGGAVASNSASSAAKVSAKDEIAVGVEGESLHLGGWCSTLRVLFLSFLQQIFGTIFSVKNFNALGDKSGLSRSAFFLVMFMVIHSVGNLHVFGGPNHFNAYGYFYVRLYWTGFGLNANIVEEYLALAGLLHVFVALKRTSQQAKAIVSTPSRWTLILSGLTLLVFSIVHLKQFRLGQADCYWIKPQWMWPFFLRRDGGYPSEQPGFTPVRDIYKLELQVFADPITCGFYTICVLIFGIHMWTGWTKLANNKLNVAANQRWVARLVGQVLTVLVVLFYLSFVVYAGLGWADTSMYDPKLRTVPCSLST